MIVAADILQPVGRGNDLQDIGLADALGFLEGDKRRIELAPGHEGQSEDVLRLVVREARERSRDHLAEVVRDVGGDLLRLGMSPVQGTGNQLLEHRVVGEREVEDV
jgi:hypothetical protein